MRRKNFTVVVLVAATALLLNPCNAEASLPPYPELPESKIVSEVKAVRKQLIFKGSRIPAGVICFSPGNIGDEIGSIVTVKKRFRIEEFAFKVVSCTMPGCSVRLNVYHAEKGDRKTGKAGALVAEPIDIEIPVNEKPEKFNINTDILLEPGDYYISMALTGCSEEAAKAWEKARSEKRINDAFYLARLDFPIFLKTSFAKDCGSAELINVMSNLGLTASGTEYASTENTY